MTEHDNEHTPQFDARADAECVAAIQSVLAERMSLGTAGRYIVSDWTSLGDLAASVMERLRPIVRVSVEYDRGVRDALAATAAELHCYVGRHFEADEYHYEHCPGCSRYARIRDALLPPATTERRER